MKRFRRGLVVGKFCPLHRGHEFLIGSALAACDELLLLSYTGPEFPRCEPAARRRWLEQRFPPARHPGLHTLVLDQAALDRACARHGIQPLMPLPHNDDAAEDHRAFCAWVCRHLFASEVDAVFSSEDYGAGFAQALTRQFARPVAHVAVDGARQRMPVSGSRVRADPYAQRRWLAPEVYASFVDRIALLGGESSGKTTLAAALAERLDTVWVPEYGRQLWVERGGELGFDDLLDIAETQCAREDHMARAAHRWLICDTSPLSTLFYCLHDFGRAPQRLLELAQRPYALQLLCDNDFDFVQDGTRRDDGFRQQQWRWHLEQLERSGARFLRLQGSPAQRIGDAVAALQADSGSGQ